MAHETLGYPAWTDVHLSPSDLGHALSLMARWKAGISPQAVMDFEVMVDPDNASAIVRLRPSQAPASNGEALPP